MKAEVTLNEVLRECNCKREESVKRPTPAKLQKKYRCITRFSDEKLRYAVVIYDNGYATYYVDCRHTVVDLTELKDFGEMSWVLAVTMKGEEQVYENMFGFLTEKACPREPEEEELEANRKPVLSAHINDPETAYIRKELRAQLKKALSKAKAELTDKQLEVYTLRYENGMTLEEIGEKLNIAVNAVVKRLNGIAKKYHAHIENIR